jgi:nicotinamidase-related amidase
MLKQLFKKQRKYVLIDVNTQKDYFLADGKALIRNHRRILAHIRRIMAWARLKNVPVISTCEVYPKDHHIVDYCIAGTDGQKKIRYTLLNNRTTFPADASTDLPADILRQFKQVIFQKRCPDPFDEPRIERLLSEIRAGTFIVVGACAEGAVSSTVLGLLQRGKNVSVVVDAVGSRQKRDAKLALRKMRAKGARLIETRRLAGNSHLRRVGICSCEMCGSHPKKSPPALAKSY